MSEQQKTSMELEAMHRNLLNEMKRKQERAAIDIWDEYMPELRWIAGQIKDAKVAEREAAIAEGTPPDEYSKPIDTPACAI